MSIPVDPINIENRGMVFNRDKIIINFERTFTTIIKLFNIFHKRLERKTF